MRLIDAEYALATSISGLIRTIEGEPWIRVKEVRDSLKNVPTFDIDNVIAEHENIGYEKGLRDGYAEAVDAEPIRHGKWIEQKVITVNKVIWQSAKCSVCGKYHVIPYMYYFSNYDYCPNCGAKMDKIEEWVFKLDLGGATER